MKITIYPREDFRFDIGITKSTSGKGYTVGITNIDLVLKVMGSNTATRLVERNLPLAKARTIAEYLATAPLTVVEAAYDAGS